MAETPLILVTMDWRLIAGHSMEEFGEVIAELSRGEREARGQPVGTVGEPVPIPNHWWARPIIHAEHADGVSVIEKGHRLPLPLTMITIIDQPNSMIWENRLTGPRVEIGRVETRKVNGTGAQPAKIDVPSAIRRLHAQGMRPGRNGTAWKEYHRAFETLTGRRYSNKQALRLIRNHTPDGT
jgi:hypothetical protein